MARAACCAAQPSAAGATLRRTYFLQPLILGGEALWVSCELEESANRFDISSSRGDGEASTTHSAGDAALEVLESRLRSPTSQLRGVCTDTVDAARIYVAFVSVGLEYGPCYRLIREAWRNGDHGVALGKLCKRTRRQGTQVHPADLDAALQLTSLVTGSSTGETKLPFKVSEAVLTAARGHLFGAVERQGADSTGVWLIRAAVGVAPCGQVSGFESRALKALAQPTAAPRHKPRKLTCCTSPESMRSSPCNVARCQGSGN